MAQEWGRAVGTAYSGAAPADAFETPLRTVFEAAPQAILLVDSKGLILQANGGAESLFGYTRAEMEGHPVEMLLPGRDDDANPDSRIHYFLTGEYLQPEQGADYAGRRKGGTEFPVAIELRRSSWKGTPIVIAFISDITQRKKLESRLIEVQRIEVAGHLVASIVHDFNNLLTIINGHNHILLDQLPRIDPLSENSREIQNAVQRSSGLVKELLSFSRRQCAPAQKTTPLNGAIYDMDGMIRRLLPPNLELTFRLSPRAGFVAAERGRIDQVLVNLVLNARDALRGRGGKIHISTRRAWLNPGESHARSGPYAVLSVTDNGCGMDAIAQARLFEPFFTTKQGGTGLGLATVQRIVHQAGGLIRVKSSLNRGTTFTICLPRVEGEVETLPTTAANASSGTETILLVEDEEGIRRLITSILRKRGYRVLEAAGGKEAEKILQAHNGIIDLLLTDVNLPDSAGGAIAERLLALQPGLKVLYISGHSEEQALKRGLVAPGARFLPKPFTVDELARRVRGTLDDA
ncbi:hybrid sensor histidine kinase/response regulator [Paludibaculum fermentans]|uniref:histidine kinase n=1 Tax=Paludibaculum fermentans TaxID=1473598 RepID=A0A7S7NTV1_PALFE|nr:ATP-binding protein [Paludibaculum fermentans]QOY89718.1 response regulator [Paludibaculum fermentans]